MLNLRIIILLLSFTYAQNALSGYGHGSIVRYDASNDPLSNILSPSFNNEISLSNPSTWHNFIFTYLSTSVGFQQVDFNNSSSSNFSLSSTKLIIPWKQELAFGVSFEPFLSKKISLSDSEETTFVIDENNSIEYLRINSFSGGPSVGKIHFGRKLNNFDSFALSLGVIFGSSRSHRNILIDEENHLLQSRYYYSGTMLDLFYTSSRFNYKNSPLNLSVKIQLPINDIDVEYESYQAFIDLNNNFFHDSNDFPDIGQALLPVKSSLKNEMKIKSLALSGDYEFEPRKHFQIGFELWNDSGNNFMQDSIFPGHVDSWKNLSFGYANFSKPFSKNRYDYKTSFSFKNYSIKNLENVNEVALGFGIGINFGLTQNKLELSYKFLRRDNLHLIENESINSLNVMLSIGDLWFVKRREI